MSESAALSNKEKYVSLVTFRRDGRPVATPVWFAAMGDEFGVITETNVGKVKRIRNNSAVTITVCDIRGGTEPGAVVMNANARLVSGSEAVKVRKAIGKKYGPVYAMFAIYWNVTLLLDRLRRKNETRSEIAIIFTLNLALG